MNDIRKIDGGLWAWSDCNSSREAQGRKYLTNNHFLVSYPPWGQKEKWGYYTLSEDNLLNN